MAVTIGTNAGFVTVAPTANPLGSGFASDDRSTATKDTTPAVLTKITEVGWWCDNATEETNFEVGLYSHDAPNNHPEALLFSDTVNAKGTSLGWKTVVVDWTIVPETIYWVAVQLDNTATSTKLDYTAGERYAQIAASAALPDPWTHGQPNGAFVFAIYAKVQAGTTYSELSGTITGAGSVSGDMEALTFEELSGTIAGVGSLSASLGSVTVGLSEQLNAIKRLVVAGKDRIYYEDI